MHELSIAVELVELAAAEAQRLGNVHVVALHLKLGPLSGVVEDALLFSFDVAAAGTPIEGARLEIEREAVLVWCAACVQNRELTILHARLCPACGQPTPEIVSGDALELTSLEILDHAPTDR